MSSLLARLERPLMKIAGKLGQQPHLNAIRDGVVSALPLVLIGSLFMLIFQPPLGSQGALDWYVKLWWVSKLPLAINVLIGLVGLFVAFGVAHSLARRYSQDALSAGLFAAATLLLVNGTTLATAAGATKAVKMIPMANLGSSGLFVALLVGLLVPEVQRLARVWKLEITMPAGVPPAVGRSFSALIPGLLVLVPLWALVHVLGVDIFAFITKWLSAPIQALSTGGASVFFVLLVIILIDSLLWLLGVHAVAILAPIQGIWLANITANFNATLAGQAPQYMNTREALVFFIWLGGSGATLVLPFLLLRAKSAGLRAIAKIGLLPAIFNINEPLIFGVPVMMNAVLVAPFILAPVVALLTTTLAMHAHLVPVPSLIVPWTLPAPIGAFLTTRYSWQAALLSLVNIGLAALIYWPFVRALDRRMAETEETERAASTAVPA